jgi:hypothetical protein
MQTQNRRRSAGGLQPAAAACLPWHCACPIGRSPAWTRFRKRWGGRAPTPCARSSSAGWRRRRVRCGRAASGHAETTLGRGTRVKWMLVVIVLGSTPVQTDLVFDTLDQCYRAEQQMRIEYTKAFDEWLKWAVQNPTESDYPKSREFMMQRLMSGVCVPHSGLPNSN